MQVVPQLIGPGEAVTVPVPVPPLVTLRVTLGVKLKLAVQVLLGEFKVTVVAVLVPLQFCPQLEKVEVASGIA